MVEPLLGGVPWGVLAEACVSLSTVPDRVHGADRQRELGSELRDRGVLVFSAGELFFCFLFKLFVAAV